MKYVKVTEIDIPLTKEYDVTNYPGRGLYYVRESNTMYMVASASPGSAPFVTGLAMGSAGSLIDEFEELTTVAAPTTSYSEDFILKAIAIAQQPQLAVNLLAKPA